MQLAPLGETLLRRGLITDAQLTQALLSQKRHGGRLGDILVSHGVIGHYALYQAVAEHYGLPFVDLIKNPADPKLFEGLSSDMCLRYRAVPWRREDGHMVIAVCELSEDIIGWVLRIFGNETELVITSPFDIRKTVEKQFSKSLDSDSRLSLWKRRPDISARVTVPMRQKQVFYGLGIMSIGVIAALPMASALAFIAFCHIAYTATMIFKCTVFVRGALTPTTWRWKDLLAAQDERTLPVYTILIPMYREASSLPGLLESMKRLDYPPCKLDIKLVLEADDKATYKAACDLKPDYHFEIVRVPPSQPRTKPKACNYALRFARGELVTVFDADDRPERLQLKKAVAAFRTHPPEVVCLQARLNYYNANDNLLTRFFSLEYTMLFHFMLYGLQRFGIPIPLGGTSNHIALSRLKELGEWDPYNVTEDADLGTRLAARGYRTAMLDSYTIEEAPNTLLPWIRQRARWIKGYMQTWLVHMRKPAAFYHSVGLRGFIGFQFFVGLSCFTFLTAPIVWGMALLWASSSTYFADAGLPGWLAFLTVFNLALNLVMHWYLSLYCALLYRKHALAMMGAAMLYPLYLVFHSVASYKAFWQLIVKPHLWEKTMHGLSKQVDSMALQQETVRTRR